eukprot:75475-Pyramimonas_sp.AAC.1
MCAQLKRHCLSNLLSEQSGVRWSPQWGGEETLRHCRSARARFPRRARQCLEPWATRRRRDVRAEVGSELVDV